jgi:hypothetical protein
MVAVAESVESLMVNVPAMLPGVRVNVAVCAPAFTEVLEIEAPVPPETLKVVPEIHEVLEPVTVIVSFEPVVAVVGETVNEGVELVKALKLDTQKSVVLDPPGLFHSIDVTRKGCAICDELKHVRRSGRKRCRSRTRDCTSASADMFEDRPPTGPLVIYELVVCIRRANAP